MALTSAAYARFQEPDDWEDTPTLDSFEHEIEQLQFRAGNLVVMLNDIRLTCEREYPRVIITGIEQRDWSNLRPPVWRNIEADQTQLSVAICAGLRAHFAGSKEQAALEQAFSDAEEQAWEDTR